MSEALSEGGATGLRLAEHVLGELDAGRAGATVVVVGGLHGNEPAGVHAAQRVLARLAGGEHALTGGEHALAGRFVALAGNLAGLAADRRFLEHDLNRIWSAPARARVRSREALERSPDEREMLALLALLDAEGARARGPLVVLDLHTSSAPGPPFCCISDALPSRRIALRLGVPILLGIEESIEGSLLEFCQERGHVAIAFEGGRHADPQTVDHHEAAIWIALAAAGVVAPRDWPEVARSHALLDGAARGFPRVVEVRFRQELLAGHGFVMEPGFQTFHRVRAGQVLARDRSGEVRAFDDGLVLLPLYQGLGSDGFFIGRSVQPTWLWVSFCLRRLGLASLLPLMPGVRRHPQRAGGLLVDPRVARWFPVEVLHLLGYRRLPPEAGRLVFARRRSAPSQRPGD